MGHYYAVGARVMPAVPRYISGRDSFVTSVRYTPSNWFIYAGVSELASAPKQREKERRRQQEGKRGARRRKGAFRETGRASHRSGIPDFPVYLDA